MLIFDPLKRKNHDEIYILINNIWFLMFDNNKFSYIKKNIYLILYIVILWKKFIK